jgi:uncharacterized protein DUF3606
MGRGECILMDMPHGPGHDDRLIDLEDPREIPYWLKFFDTTRDELFAAISAVGNSAENVKRYLREKAASMSEPPTKA